MQTPQLPPKLAQAAKLASEFILETADSVTDATATLEQIKIDTNAAIARKDEAVYKATRAQKASSVVASNAKKVAENARKEADYAVAANLDAINDSKILLADIEEQVAQANIKLAAANDAVAKANNDLATINDDIAIANTELETIRTKAAAEQLERQKHDEKLSDIKTAVDTAKAELKRLTKDCTTRQKELDTLLTTNKTEIKEHSHKIKQAIATLEELQQRRETVEGQIEKFEAYMQTERKQLDADKKTIERQKAELEKSKRRLSSEQSLLRPLS